MPVPERNETVEALRVAVNTLSQQVGSLVAENAYLKALLVVRESSAGVEEPNRAKGEVIKDEQDN